MTRPKTPGTIDAFSVAQDWIIYANHLEGENRRLREALEEIESAVTKAVPKLQQVARDALGGNHGS